MYFCEIISYDIFKVFLGISGLNFVSGILNFRFNILVSVIKNNKIRNFPNNRNLY